MPDQRAIDRRGGSRIQLGSHRATTPSRDTDPTTDTVGLTPVNGLLHGGTPLRTPKSGPTGVQGSPDETVDAVMKKAGRDMVEQACMHIETAATTVAGVIPLAASPFTLAQATPQLATARAYLGMAQNLLEQGLAMQGLIQKGAPPGGSIGPDGMPMDEGEWVQIRVRLQVLTSQLDGADARMAAALHPQLLQLLIDCRLAIADQRVREMLARTTQSGS